MTLHQTIKSQIIDALRAKDTLRLETLRGLSSLFQNEIIAQKSTDIYLPDDKALTLIKRATKQRKDSIEQFEKGGRKDLADKEKAELKILESYLPSMMSREEVRVIVSARIDKMKSEGPFDPKAGGKITGMLMKELAGKADGTDVKAVVDETLSK